MRPEHTRCFIALDLPDEIKNISVNIQSELKSRGFVDANFTERNNIHLTLKFLGEISKETLQIVSDKLKEIKFRKFNVALGNAGVFSEEDSEEVRIIWISLEGEELHELQRAVDKALEGMFVNEFRFMAHITIARVRRTIRKQELLEYLNSVKLDKKEYEIKEFALKKSVLITRGPVYSTLEVFPAQNFK